MQNWGAWEGLPPVVVFLRGVRRALYSALPKFQEHSLFYLCSLANGRLILASTRKLMHVVENAIVILSPKLQVIATTRRNYQS